MGKYKYPFEDLEYRFEIEFLDLMSLIFADIMDKIQYIAKNVNPIFPE